ncbi:polyprenol reductase isoform X2 [Agrilus planipennis]|uniref:Polyprenal reductase n=1 Tax=Agrilus planipennis TaxID=224129 RepID=A0A1W4XW38_AGRPL|nr:polyprenol reductase isoform X2 [Agrilus planipennis]
MDSEIIRCGSRSSKNCITPTSTLLAMFLLTLQCLRRVYETHFVSVFGINSRMNLAHYCIGYIHYTGCILCILSSAPKFGQHAYRYPLIQLTDLSFFDIIATLLFFWAWFHQYKTTVILGNLRKNERGEVITQKHRLPEGDWFNYVASPHLLAEILMYISLTMILWQNTSWLFISAWVLVNQIQTALLSFWWYKSTFPSFPENRKAIIPFIL